MRKYAVLFSILVVIFVTAGAFFPSLFNGFVNWDDPTYVTENDVIKELSLQNIKKMFLYDFEGLYCPLVVLSYAVEYHFFKLNPFAYHATNYFLNLLITVAVFYFIYLLSQSLHIAFVTALLFGIHPLHVESVAWVTERKDLLYAFFYMFSLISYIVYLRKEKKIYYVLCLSLGFFSFLSKAMAFTLPVILILLDYFYGRAISKKSILEKLPLFIPAGALGVINFRFQALSGAIVNQVSLPGRIYFLTKGVLFYLSKTILPVNLSAMYPYHPIAPAHIVKTLFYCVVLVLLSILVFVSKKYSKKVIFGSLFFAITILPVIKIIPIGDVFAADRYIYVSSIGIFYLLAVAFDKLLHSAIADRKVIRFSAFSVFFSIIMLFSIITWSRCAVWKDTKTLFADVLKKYPDSPRAFNKVGAFFLDRGDFRNAVGYFKKALAIDPHFTKAEDNFAKAYFLAKQQQSKEKIAPRILAENSTNIAEEVRSLNKLGVGQFNAGFLDNAILLYNDALALDPDYAQTHCNLGLVYFKKGDFDRAARSFRRALAIDPRNSKAKSQLDYINRNRENFIKRSAYPGEIPKSVLRLNKQGIEEGKAGNFDKAISLFKQSIKLFPDYAESHNNLGFSYFKKGDYERAEKHFKRALELDPNHQKARINLNYIKYIYNSGRYRKK